MNKKIFGWMMYDFANSSFTTIIVTVVYSVYFVNNVVGDADLGSALWGRAIAISMLLVAISAPIFGAVADHSRAKKRFLFFHTYLTIIFTALLFFVRSGDISKGMFYFIIANFGFHSANVFYNALLPEIVNRDKIGKISGWGWAIGYFGGMLSLFIILPLVHNNLVRYVFPVVAFFFAIFSIFIFVWIKEIRRPSQRTNYFRMAYSRIRISFKNIKKFQDLKKFIFSYFIYNDAITTIITFGAIFGKEEFSMSTKDLLFYFIILQIASMFGAFIFSFIIQKIGAKKTITITLFLWIFAVIWAFMCKSANEFYGVGILAGIAIGSSQSSSRTILALLTPPEKMAEFFGFYAFSGKLAAIIGPLIYGEIVSQTGSQKFAILSVLIFFVVGIIILQSVDEERGKQIAINWKN